MKSKIRIIFITLISLALMLSLASCTKSEKEISDNTDNTKLPIQSETPDVCPVCKCELDNHTPQISISYIFEDGVLTICGNGSMEQLYIDSKAPWAEYADEIITVNIYFGVKSIGADAFSGCENLKTVYMENGIEVIGNNAFFGCKKLEDVKLPDSLKIIGSYAFNSCESITEIYIPEGVTDIGEGAFALCTGLAKVNIPSTVVIIGELVFAGCSPDIVLTVSENNKYYTYDGKALITKDGTLLIFVHPSLPEYTVPETVTSIGKCAFYNCLLIENIKLPKSIKLIGSGVFDGCIKLKDIHYDGTAYDWTEVVGMEAVATAYAYIKINVIPVCGFCGSSEHTTHPTCPECGSYDHIEHPKLIMGHLSDSEILELAKNIYSNFKTANTLEGKDHYMPLYKKDLGSSLTEEHKSELADLVLYKEHPQNDFIPSGSLELINYNEENVSNSDWYTDRTWCIDFYSANYNTMDEYKSAVSKYISQEFASRIKPHTAYYELFIFKGKIFLIQYARGYHESTILIDTAYIEMRSENNLVISIKSIYDFDFANDVSWVHCSFIEENGNLVIDKVY